MKNIILLNGAIGLVGKSGKYHDFYPMDDVENIRLEHKGGKFAKAVVRFKYGTADDMGSIDVPCTNDEALELVTAWAEWQTR